MGSKNTSDIDYSSVHSFLTCLGHTVLVCRYRRKQKLSAGTRHLSGIKSSMMFLRHLKVKPWPLISNCIEKSVSMVAARCGDRSASLVRTCSPPPLIATKVQAMRAVLVCMKHTVLQLSSFHDLSSFAHSPLQWMQMKDKNTRNLQRWHWQLWWLLLQKDRSQFWHSGCWFVSFRFSAKNVFCTNLFWALEIGSQPCVIQQCMDRNALHKIAHHSSKIITFYAKSAPLRFFPATIFMGAQHIKPFIY